jgi:hypothetical protein
VGGTAVGRQQHHGKMQVKEMFLHELVSTPSSNVDLIVKPRTNKTEEKSAGGRVADGRTELVHF